MRNKIEELKQKMAKLEDEATELETLRQDYVTAKAFRSQLLSEVVKSWN